MKIFLQLIIFLLKKLKNELDVFIPKYSINLSNTCFSFKREILLLIEEIYSLPLNAGLKKFLL